MTFIVGNGRTGVWFPLSFRRNHFNGGATMNTLFVVFFLAAIVFLCVFDRHTGKKLYQVGKWGFFVSGALFLITLGIEIATH